MSHLDLPDGEAPTQQDYRARHSDAAPDAYPRRHRYGDRLSASPLHGEAPAVTAEPPTDRDHDAGPAGPAAPRTAEPAAPRPAQPQVPVTDESAPTTEQPVRRAGRAGRDLPAAIGVGLALGAAVIASLFLWRPAFLGVVLLAVGVATWELVRAVRSAGVHAPLVPLLAGGAVMIGLAWYGGADALTLGLLATVLAALVWRLADGPAGYQRDLVATVLVAVYVPFLGGFAVLLARPDDGALRVLVSLAAVVLSDTGGYAAGVFLGRHPMAPSVSPKKSWEGFGGSLLAAALGGALMLYFLFGVVWWAGALFGLAVATAAVVGDLAESLIKRDLGIKDMSNLLPGHGGVMDRVDSILFAAPAAYAVLTLVAPVPG
jgi:phosphatidate cytidylyltransferase